MYNEDEWLTAAYAAKQYDRVLWNHIVQKMIDEIEMYLTFYASL